MRNPFNQIVAATVLLMFLSVILLVLCNPAYAGSISRGGSSYSRSSSSFSSPPRSLGTQRGYTSNGGGSLGLYSSPRFSTPSSPSPSRSYTPPPQYDTSHTTVNHYGSSGGSSFLHSLGGSFLGSWLGSSMANHGTAVVAPVGAPMTSGGVVPTGEVIVQSESNYFGWIFLVFLVCIILYVWFKSQVNYKYKKVYLKTETKTNGEILPLSPVQFFISVQKAYAERNIPELKNLLGPNMIDQMLEDLPPEGSKYTLGAISYGILKYDSATNDYSIHYKAVDRVDNSEISEVWNIVWNGTTYVLDGIEPLI